MKTLLYGIGAAVVGRGVYGTPRISRKEGQPATFQPDSPSADSNPRWSREQMANARRRTEAAVEAAEPTLDEVQNAPARDVVDVVIVGGCAAGLSAARCLAEEGVEQVVVLEKNEHSGDNWRSRYHRLHLHDIIDECHLPYQPMPDTYPEYPSRQQFATYLDSYAEKLPFRVRGGHVVELIDKNESTGLWHVVAVDTSTRRRIKLDSKHVIIANGIYGEPQMPDIPGAASFQGHVTHACGYTNASDMKVAGKRTLVVGFGNSGAEIALDVAEHNTACGQGSVDVLVRSRTPIIPRWSARVAFAALYRYAFLAWLPFLWLLAPVVLVLADVLAKLLLRLRWGYVERYGIVPSWRGPGVNMITTLTPPLMDVGTMDCIRRGIIGVKSVTIMSFTPTGVVFADGSKQDYDAVIFATGYKFLEGHANILAPNIAAAVGTGVRGALAGNIVSGRESRAAPGLWFVFGRLQMIRDSALPLGKKLARKLGRPVRSSWSTALLVLRHVLFAAIVYAYWSGVYAR